MRVAQRLLGDPDAAADAVQEGLIKAYRAWANGNERNPRDWFLRIVTNACYDYLSCQKRRPADSLDALLEVQGEREPKLVRPIMRLDPPTQDQPTPF